MCSYNQWNANVLIFARYCNSDNFLHYYRPKVFIMTERFSIVLLTGALKASKEAFEGVEGKT